MARRRTFLILGLFAGIGLTPAASLARSTLQPTAAAPSEITLAYSQDRASPGVEIAVPGRKPLYVASLVPRYDKDHRQTLVELVVDRIGDKSPKRNLLAPTGAVRGHQLFQFYPSDFAPGVKMPASTSHRVIVARSIRMRLLVDVTQSGVQQEAGAKGRTFRFQTLILRLTAQDVGRRR